MPGPAPTPTEALKIRGSKRGRRRVAEPTPTGKLSCPGHLDAVARKEFRRVVKSLTDSGMAMGATYLGPIVAYCEAWSRMVRASKKLSEQGDCLVGKTGGEFQNPWLAIYNKAQEQVVKFGAEFGMTAASKSRCQIDKKPTIKIMSRERA